jgi:hypothetical protein
MQITKRGNSSHPNGAVHWWVSGDYSSPPAKWSYSAQHHALSRTLGIKQVGLSCLVRELRSTQ